VRRRWQQRGSFLRVNLSRDLFSWSFNCRSSAYGNPGDASALNRRDRKLRSTRCPRHFTLRPWLSTTWIEELESEPESSSLLELSTFKENLKNSKTCRGFPRQANSVFFYLETLSSEAVQLETSECVLLKRARVMSDYKVHQAWHTKVS
jgi:hypothetical protein